MKKLLALTVHIFTSFGIVCGFLAILAISEQEWKLAMLWLLVALIIDGVDGSFARWLKVKERLPGIDGKSIDFVVDFANYALIPVYFIHQAQLVDESVNLFTAIAILVVSALYYGKSGMVTDDLFFRGFPVLWNMAACYLYFIWDLGKWGNFIAIMIMCVLHFVPIKYVYPSQTPSNQFINIIATIVFFITTIASVYLFPQNPFWLNLLASISVLYLFVVGLYYTFRPTS